MNTRNSASVQLIDHGTFLECQVCQVALLQKWPPLVILDPIFLLLRSTCTRKSGLALGEPCFTLHFYPPFVEKGLFSPPFRNSKVAFFFFDFHGFFCVFANLAFFVLLFQWPFLPGKLRSGWPPLRPRRNALNILHEMCRSLQTTKRGKCQEW